LLHEFLPEWLNPTMRWQGESKIKITLKILRIGVYIDWTCPCASVLHLYGFFIICVSGSEAAGQFFVTLSNKRSWVIYGGTTQLPRSGKAQGRFAKSCPSIRETSIVLQETEWTAAAVWLCPICESPDYLMKTLKYPGILRTAEKLVGSSAALVAIT
jgi:hypothetical protein